MLVLGSGCLAGGLDSNWSERRKASNRFAPANAQIYRAYVCFVRVVADKSFPSQLFVHIQESGGVWSCVLFSIEQSNDQCWEARGRVRRPKHGAAAGSSSRKESLERTERDQLTQQPPLAACRSCASSVGRHPGLCLLQTHAGWCLWFWVDFPFHDLLYL